MHLGSNVHDAPYTMFKIATWNVNSIRVRLEQVLGWLAEEGPDVLAVQETKTTDSAFPAAAFAEIGYRAAFAGERAYNGVALLSKRRNHGLRIDLILASASLATRCAGCRIDKAPRRHPKTSDHTPVVAEFAWDPLDGTRGAAPGSSLRDSAVSR